LPPDLEIQE